MNQNVQRKGRSITTATSGPGGCIRACLRAVGWRLQGCSVGFCCLKVLGACSLRDCSRVGSCGDVERHRGSWGGGTQSQRTWSCPLCSSSNQSSGLDGQIAGFGARLLWVTSPAPSLISPEVLGKYPHHFLGSVMGIIIELTLWSIG